MSSVSRDSETTLSADIMSPSTAVAHPATQDLARDDDNAEISPGSPGKVSVSLSAEIPSRLGDDSVSVMPICGTATDDLSHSTSDVLHDIAGDEDDCSADETTGDAVTAATAAVAAVHRLSDTAVDSTWASEVPVAVAAISCANDKDSPVEGDAVIVATASVALHKLSDLSADNCTEDARTAGTLADKVCDVSPVGNAKTDGDNAVVVVTASVSDGTDNDIVVTAADSSANDDDDDDAEDEQEEEAVVYIDDATADDAHAAVVLDANDTVCSVSLSFSSSANPLIELMDCFNLHSERMVG